MDNRSTGFALIFDRTTIFRRFSNARTSLSTAYDILLLLTSHLLESIDVSAVISSVTKQPSVQMSRNANSAEKSTNTIEIVRMVSNAPMATPNTWLAHQNTQCRFSVVERRDKKKTRKEKMINSHQPPIFPLLLACIRVFFKRWLLMCMQRRRHRSIPNHHQYTEGRNRTLSRDASRTNHATRREIQCSS